MSVIWYSDENSYDGNTMFCISDDYTCSDMEYIDNPIVVGQLASRANNGYESVNTISSDFGYEIVNSEYKDGRYALYIVETLNWSQYSMKYGLTQDGNIDGASPIYQDFKRYIGDTAEQSLQGVGLTNYTDGYYNINIATNIPIFENYNDYVTFIRTGNGIDKAINYKASDVEPPTDEILLYSYGVLQTWDNTGLIYENDSSSVAFHKGIRGKLKSGSISLYPINGIDDASLKYGIKMSNDISWLYLEEVDGHSYTWVERENVTIDFLYRNRINELGTFHASKIALDTNAEYNAKIPIFADEQTAQDYIDGNADITDAINWSTISGNYPIANGTGTGDTQTDFGQVYAKNFFSQCYLCGATAIQEIANALFDTDATGITHFWDKIKEGVEMYGNDPMQSVQGLTYFPVNLTSLFTNYQSQQYVYFGGYKLDLSVSVNRLIFPDGYKTLGTFTLKKTFKNWRDYEPYSKAYIFLPYVGTYQLDLARYYDKTTEVRYYIDVRTGGCVACLIADGVLTDYYNGQMGVQMPITLTDKSSYANAQIETLLGGLRHEGSVLQGAGQTGSVGGSAGMYVAVAQATAGTMLNASMSTYKLTENNLNNYNKTKGGSSSMLNEYLPQYVTLMLEIQQDDPTENHGMLLGKPTNASGTVGSFSGFLQVDSVNLQCGIATPNEKKEILSALLNGIFI